MKKKIKDLTLEEVKNICEKNKECDTCPLIIAGMFPCGIANCTFVEDKEIEVKEDE